LPGNEAILEATRNIRGAGQLMNLVSHATLDQDLSGLMADKTSREVLRRVLIDRYFPEKRRVVLDLCREEEAIGRRELYDESGDLDTAERAAESIRNAAFG
jgi:hypothetical protein